MKIGDKVKLHTPNYESIALISGEDVDPRSPDRWLISCPEKNIRNAVFYKESEGGKYYAFGNPSIWIEAITNE